MPPTRFQIRVNSKSHEVHVEPQTALIFVLRNQLGLMSPKLGCGLGQCGACAVLVDGGVELSCTSPIDSVSGREVETIEAWAETDDWHPVQQAFLDENAAQCGFCLTGILIRTKALLDAGNKLSDGEIKAALAPHLCRCGAHPRMLRAVRRLVGID